ncbi:MAG: hypothetical protein H6Q54_716, partial [Deltaproteobacteria bacterium]|nr:hypothetical protein [Deltaproteobacteria bacterium]
SVEVVSRVLTTFQHCASCGTIFRETGVEDAVNKEALAEYPQDLQEEFLKLSDLIRELRRLYQHRIRIELINAQSPLGIYKTLRHHIRQYPAFIVEKKDVCVGWDWQKLSDVVDMHIKTA